MVSDSSMRKTPPFLYSCTLQWILKQGKGCFTELGLVKRRVSLFTVWLTCSEENLRLLSASSFFKRQVCSPKTSVDMLRALKLTLTRQFTGISLSTRSGTNYRTAARVFFALSPSSLPPCQWSQTKEIVLGAQQTLLIVLMGCNCSSRTAANHNTACKKQCEPAEFCSQSSKVTLAKKLNDEGCETIVLESTIHLWSMGFCHNPLLSMEWIWVGLQTALFCQSLAALLYFLVHFNIHLSHFP